MIIQIPEELNQLCKEIIFEGKTNEQWSQIESDDMFQKENLTGGYDATEKAFCFSYYGGTDGELWFQITLDEVGEIARGEKSSVDVRIAD